MKTTWKGLLAGTAALAIVACTPAEDAAEDAETVDETAEVEAGDDAMMAADGDMAETSEEGTDDAAETEEDERDPHGNPAGPLASDAEG